MRARGAHERVAVRRDATKSSLTEKRKRDGVEVHLLDSYVGVLPACRGVRAAHNFPLSGVTEVRMWGAYEKISERRANAREI